MILSHKEVLEELVDINGVSCMIEALVQICAEKANDFSNGNGTRRHFREIALILHDASINIDENES